MGGDVVSVTFDFSKLRGLIREHFESQESFAKAIGMSTTSLSVKLNNKVPFSSLEISKAMEVLGLPNDQIDNIFFVRKYGGSNGN
jgi:DNA-binding XRE family transcriptional regulator